MTKKDNTYVTPALKSDETLIFDNAKQSDLLYELLNDIIGETFRVIDTDTLMKLIEVRSLANEINMNADSIIYRYRNRW